MHELKGAEVFREAGIDTSDMKNKCHNVEAFYVEGCGHEKELVEARESWQVGVDEPTSDEDEGHIKPQRGAGRLGRGAPTWVEYQGQIKPFADGAGLCSPGRRPPDRRTIDPIAIRMNTALMELLRAWFDVERLGYE